MVKKNPSKFARSRPLCNLNVISSFGAEKKEEDIHLSDRQQKKNYLWWFSVVVVLADVISKRRFSDSKQM